MVGWGLLQFSGRCSFGLRRFNASRALLRCSRRVSVRPGLGFRFGGRSQPGHGRSSMAVLIGFALVSLMTVMVLVTFVPLVGLMAMLVRRLAGGSGALADARLLGLDLDGRGDFNRRAPAAAAEPFAHGFGQADAEHAHVVGDLVTQSFLAALGEDRLALDAKLFGKLIDSDTFSQNRIS
jgi:hypothetical protein